MPAAPTIGLTVLTERVKGARIGAGSEIEERRLRRQDDRGTWGGKDVETAAERRGRVVQGVRVERAPHTRVEAEQQRFHGGDGFGGREGAVAGAMHENLPHERGITARATTLL